MTEPLMTVPIGLESLPVELIAIIFEQVCEQPCLKFREWNADDPRPFRLEPYCPHEVTCSDGEACSKEADCMPETLLAAINVSRRIRAVTQDTLKIWQCIAELACYSLEDRRLQTTIDLLSLCAAKSDHRLNAIDLRRLASRREADCPGEMLKLLQVVSSSTISLQELRLSAFDGSDDRSLCNYCHSCKNESGRRNTMAAMHRMTQDAWRASLELLLAASSIRRLSMPVSDVTALNWTLPQLQDIQTKPETLMLTVAGGGKMSSELFTLCSRLAREAKDVRIRTAPFWPSLGGEVAKTIVMSAHASLQHLELHELGPATIWTFDLPVLKTLHFRWSELDDDRQSLGHRKLFPSLESLEAPGWILKSVDVPDLKKLSVHLEDLEQAEDFHSSLQGWPKLEDLIVQFAMNETDDGQVSIVCQRLLHSLTPSEAGEPLLCSNLERICIIGDIGDVFDDVAFHQLVTDTAFKAPYEPPRGYWVPLDYVDPPGDYYGYNWACAPKIGFDIFHLDKQRREASVQVSGVGQGRRLKVLQLHGCIVDPKAWTLLLQTSTVENTWCYPDPYRLWTNLYQDDIRGQKKSLEECIRAVNQNQRYTLSQAELDASEWKDRGRKALYEDDPSSDGSSSDEDPELKRLNAADMAELKRFNAARRAELRKSKAARRVIPLVRSTKRRVAKRRRIKR